MRSRIVSKVYRVIIANSSKVFNRELLKNFATSTYGFLELSW